MNDIQPFFIDTNGTVKFTTLSKSTIYKLEKEEGGTFPARVHITLKRTGFVFSEVRAWADKKVKTSMEKAIKRSAK